jgi:carboxypeptidase Taq
MEGAGGPVDKKLNELKRRLAEIADLNSAGAVLGWDQATYMPPGGAAARGRQMAILSRIAQEKLIDPEIGRLLDELRPYEESLSDEDDDASLIRQARLDFERALRIPPEYLSRLNLHSAESYTAWSEARPANDFNRVRPYLEKTLDLSREMAGFFPGYRHIADPLIDLSDRGMTAASVRRLFADLRRALLPIVQKITVQPEAEDACLREHYPGGEQLAFSKTLVGQLGYDLQRGRIDLTQHPFTTTFSPGDVRITTRVREDYLAECLFSDIHEAGHGMYEQGLDPSYEATPLAGGTSAGMHESQSRLWENLVGRSHAFWQFFFPRLRAAFPQQLKGIKLEGFYRAINKVERSLIRTDADEVTYNLHILLRFEFELSLLEGTLAVRDLPEAWRARYQSDLGITPANDRVGCLQDVHWYAGLIGGAFQGYTLGNVIAAQVYAAALRAHPEIPEEMTHGRFETLRGWLAANIYRHGRKYTAQQLVQSISGAEIGIEPYIQYLRSKYGELYSL